MPRVRGFTNEQKIKYQKKKIADTCEYLLIDKSIKKNTIASCLGVTPQAISYQFRHKQLTLEVVMCVLTLANVDSDKIKELLTIEGVSL